MKREIKVRLQTPLRAFLGFVLNLKEKKHKFQSYFSTAQLMQCLIV